MLTGLISFIHVPGEISNGLTVAASNACIMLMSDLTYGLIACKLSAFEYVNRKCAIHVEVHVLYHYRRYVPNHWLHYNVFYGLKQS